MNIKQKGALHKRQRRISRESLKILRKLFKKNRYPSKSEKEYIAVEANIKKDQVNSWFNERRKLQKCIDSCQKLFCKCLEKKKIKQKNNKILIRSFETNQYLESASELQRLKQETSLSELIIKKWFINRRYRLAKKGHCI